MDSGERPHGHAVLVVADFAETRDAYATMLRFLHVEVVTAWGGADALRTLGAGFRPCVMLFDFRIVLDGASLRRRMRTKPELANIPIVLITDGRAHVVVADIDGFLQKPVDADILLAAIEKYCERRAERTV